MSDGVKEKDLDAAAALLEDLNNASPYEAVALSTAFGMKPKRRLNANDRHRMSAEAARRAERKTK